MSSSGYRASDGAAYDWFLGRWTARLAPLLIEFSRLPPGAGMLDVGCGTGGLVCVHAMRGGAVAAVDLSQPYLDHARVADAQGRIDWRKADAAALPFAAESFDGILAQFVLNFLPNPARGVAEMARVARPGGIVAAAVWDFRGGLVYQRLFWDTAAGLDDGAAAVRRTYLSGAPDGPRSLTATAWAVRGVAP